MGEFKIECYITSDENENTKLSEMPEKDFESWRKDMETRALGEYYNRKIEILDDKKAFD